MNSQKKRRTGKRAVTPADETDVPSPQIEDTFFNFLHQQLEKNRDAAVVHPLTSHISDINTSNEENTNEMKAIHEDAKTAANDDHQLESTLRDTLNKQINMIKDGTGTGPQYQMHFRNYKNFMTAENREPFPITAPKVTLFAISEM